MAAASIPHIVIFGGGFAGAKLFDQLGTLLRPREAELTLVNQWPFLYYNVAVPRSLVDPVTTPVEKLVYPLKHLCKTPDQRLVVGWIQEIHARHAVISRATESTGASDWHAHLNRAHVRDATTESFTLAFDYAVIALGSHYAFPGKIPAETSLQELSAKFTQLQENLRSASKVLILGAGPVGLEYAGEIKTEFPDKSVTLAGNALFSTSPAFLRKLQAVLQRKKVSTVLGTRFDADPMLAATRAGSFPVHLPAPVAVALDATTTVEADLILRATGAQPNAAAVRLAGAVDAQGWVKVNACFQVEPETHVFAIGDVAASGCGKYAYIAMQHADHLAQNLVKLLRAKPGTHVALKPFAPPPPMCVLAMGRDDGVAQIPLLGTFMGSRIAKMVKGDGGFMSAKRFLGPSALQSKSEHVND